MVEILDLTKTPGQQVTEAAITVLAQVSVESNPAAKAKCGDEEDSVSKTVVLTLGCVLGLPGELLNCPMHRPQPNQLNQNFWGWYPGIHIF